MVEENPADHSAGVQRIGLLIQQARFDEAVAAARQQLDGAADADSRRELLYRIAVAERYRGHPQDAIPVLERIVDEREDWGRAHQELGHAHRAMGDTRHALAAYRRAVELNPALVASWRCRAQLSGAIGRSEEAEVASRQLRYLSSLPGPLIDAMACMHDGELGKAERLCRRFLERQKHHVEGMRLLAEVAVRMGVYDDAEFLLESCVELWPEHAPARLDYLNLLVRKTRFQQAREQAEMLIALGHDGGAVRLAFAAALVGLGEVEQGIAEYRRVLDGQPDNASVWVQLGHALKSVGEYDEAVASYRRGYQLKADFGDAFWSLANTKTYRFSDDELAQVARFEAAPGTATDDRVHLCFAAGKALEDRRRYAEAFEYYERGNALKRRQLRYDPGQFERRVRAQIETVTRELLDSVADAGCPAPDPIFIVGLPRAGSTLLEQILASHSQVDGTMELHNVLALAQRLRGRTGSRSPRYPAILHELDPDYFRRFGEQYLENTRVYRAGAPLFVDKMPNNFLHVGLIRLMLPNAKVIDARRDPMACCFSNFKQLFGEGQEFSYGLTEVGRYYNGYVRLMDHWDQVLPGFVLRVMHEEVVADLESQVRRLLAFCGLPFEPACLEFHNTERSVRTPSSEQVRQPIFRSGLDRWRHFEDHLQPLIDALGPDVLARFSTT